MTGGTYSTWFQHQVRTVPLILLMGLWACDQQPETMTIPSNAEERLLSLQLEEKYVEDMKQLYPGISDPSMRPLLSEKVNAAIDDFLTISKKGNPTDATYLDAIHKGLARFEGLALDTEDRERTALYFQQLMDIVGLKSSEGALNTFIYGFDPE